MEALPQDLADFLVTKNFDPEYFDDKGQPAEAGNAKTMKFDYVASTGKNYGTAVCVIADDELSLFYGDNLGRGMEPEDKDEWYTFLEELSNKAASHAATWSPRDINQLKHTLAGIAAIKEGLFEGYYGNRRVSYMGEQTQARLVINHNRVLGEDDKRYRYVESLFIETADQERFRLQFKSLAGGRAMLEHVRSGGRPYDVRGNHITEIVSEMAVLSRFNRAQNHRVYEGVTQELVESAQQYYRNLQETVKHLGSPRGYQAYFENWAPDQVGEAEALVENLRNLFVEQTLDARIEAALPTLAKIQQQGNNMKEAQIFENWINNLSEGTWALPETPEQMEKLNQLMSAELIVGPDATNATELLYDIVGDDELFDILNDLADRSEGRANIWDDSDVQRRLAELGVQTPQSTEAEPADVPQDTAPDMKEGQLELNTPDPVVVIQDKQGKILDKINLSVAAQKYKLGEPENIKKQLAHQNYTTVGNYTVVSPMTGQPQDATTQGMAEGFGDTITRGIRRAANAIIPGAEKDAGDYGAGKWDKNTNTSRNNLIDWITVNQLDVYEDELLGYFDKFVDGGGSEYKAGEQAVNTWKARMKRDGESVRKPDELAEMLKYAGVPIRESVLTDSTGSTLEHIKDTFKRDVKDFTQSGDMSDALYDALYDYYFDDMPYGTKKARDGDPHEWVADRFAQDIGIDEGVLGTLGGAALGNMLGGPIGAAAGAVGGQEMTKGGSGLIEGSCNMTMEGSYCPEHGLAKCESMYEDGGAVGMPYSMGEGQPPHPKELEMDALVRSMQIKQRADDAEKRLSQRAAEPHTLGQKIKKDIGDPLSKLFKGDVKGALSEVDDPINSNSAMTGSYYEGKETRTQEGDALLARIKSLALLR